MNTLARALGRQLCRIRLHRWRSIRKIAGLDHRGQSLTGPTFAVTASYFTDRCIRPGCGKERTVS